MTFFTLVFIISTIVLPIIATDSSFNAQAFDKRALQGRDGIVGTPIVASPSPTTTVINGVTQNHVTASTTRAGIVGVPIKQTTSPTPSSTLQVGIAQSTSPAPKVGIPQANPPTTNPPTSPGVVGKPLSQPFNEHSISRLLPNSVIIVLVIGAVFIFSMVGLVAWQIEKRRSLGKSHKGVEDEDALEAYSKYWKGKRNSAGSGSISSPADEKNARNENV